jgi:4a-hydroxytetrahydrobiopterin dehydratase
MSEAALSRSAASTAVEPFGWRLVLGNYLASVPVDGLAAAVEVARLAAHACGADADGHLRVDLRPDRVELAVQTRPAAELRARDVELVHAITTALARSGHPLAPPTGPARPVQLLEIAIDALDIAAIRPFWLAVLGYRPETGDEGPQGAIVDPVGQLPTIWFQQMTEPRPQRNRIHLDITVAHDEAEPRLRAALDAGGLLVSDAAARSFWILADVEGNEICICTWQDRD